MPIRRLAPADALLYRSPRPYRAAGFRSFGIEPDAIRVEGRSCAKNHMHLDLGSTS